MAFSFGSPGNAQAASLGAGGASAGPDLELITTEALGFKSIAGDAKVRISSPWVPAPAETASLMTIAPRSGIVATASPDSISIATTESVRKAFESPSEGDSDVRGFTPQLKVPLPMRISHIAFTADEKHLLLSAETGGGLAVYEVQALQQGNLQAAFELGTDGEALRDLVPNPAAEMAGLCAIVTNSGSLRMANLNARNISNPLKTHVSCISWSTRGKQLVAGVADGTIHQLTPEGEIKAEIPAPPGVSNAHVASLSWLENNLFLAIHTTTNESPPASIYHIITRTPPSSFIFQKITDPVDPFGAENAPRHTISRLKDFPPALQDVLIISSTASPDIGLLTRSKTPLSPDKPADAITGVFTTTELLDDSKRAQLPMSESMDNTVPIGAVLDLSSKEKVYKPLPADEELEESPGPLPGYWVLNNEGILSSWWVIYESSIRQGATYPGLAATASTGAVSSPAPALAAATSQATAFGSPSSTGAFGSPAPAPAPAPAFGGASALGAKASPWGASQTSATATPGNQSQSATFGSSTFGSTPASSSPAFGKPTAVGFGQSAQLGMRASPWGNASGSGSPGSGAPAFGQSGFAGMGASSNTKSVFGGGDANKSSPAAPTSGGFAGFAGSSGFAAMGGANNNTSGASIFSSKPASGSTSTGSPFGSAAQATAADTAFPAPKSTSTGLFGQAEPFKLGTTFKPDPAAKDDNEKPEGSLGKPLFGTGFSSTLNDTAKQSVSKEEDMDTGEPTPQTAFSKSPFSLGGQPEATGKSIFGMGAAKPTQDNTQQKSPFGFPKTQEPDQANKPTGLFGLQSTTPTTTPAPNRFDPKPILDTPASKGGLFSLSSTSSSGGSGLFKTPETKKGFSDLKTPAIKVNAEKKSPFDAPLPPESTSKNTYPLGESSSSSGATTDGGNIGTTGESAPLPPDFLATPKQNQTKRAEEAPLPPDFLATPRPSAQTPLKKQLVSSVGTPLPPEGKGASPKTSSPFQFPSSSKGPDSLPSSEDAPLPPDFVTKPKPAQASTTPAIPEEGSDSDLEEGELEEDNENDEAESEGSGVIVGKDSSPTTTTNLTPTPGFTPQSSFGGMAGSTFNTSATPQTQPDRQRHLFGEIGRNAPVFPRPNVTSPRSPSPVRNAIPSRLSQHQASRSVSAPGMASQILGHSSRSVPQQTSTMATKPEQDAQLKQQRLARSRREAEEAKVLEDEEDDEIQMILASEVEPTLQLDDFIAHTNAAQIAQETIPAQAEAVYRDINSMIDTLGLNARSVAAFVQGHLEKFKPGGRHTEDLENGDDWVLCEVDELGDVVERDLAQELMDGRAHDVQGKLESCQELAREMSRLRSKQDDLKKLISVRLDPDQADISRSLPLSAEQATQQNELRRELARFSKKLAEAEEALTLLKAKLASAGGAQGGAGSKMPTVEAVMRTITKLTSMIEKRSGDIDVLENQMRKLRFSSVNSREGSPMVTPQKNNRSLILSPDASTGSPLNMRNSLMSSFASTVGGGRNSTPRKKISGFSQDEKNRLMEAKAKRQAVLDKLKAGVTKNGVQPWPMPDDTE